MTSRQGGSDVANRQSPAVGSRFVIRQGNRGGQPCAMCRSDLIVLCSHLIQVDWATPDGKTLDEARRQGYSAMNRAIDSAVNRPDNR